MNKIILACLISLSFIGTQAQNKNPYKIYSDSLAQLKKEGKLNGEEWFYNPNATKGLHISGVSKKGARLNNNNNVMSTACNCWIPRDTSFHPAPLDGSGGAGGPGVAPLYQNDDWSTNGITLPFPFCFYGATVGTSSNQLFINNNGNISFGSAYGIFSAVPFPSSSYVMIAPFWADVATVLPSSTSIPGYNTSGGVVYYKLTPTYLVVQWDSVGIYNHPGQINSFQLIITNGTDPILPPGNNISFCYGEMQWACGDASSGTNGFGYGNTSSSAATVGLNKGDGVNYTEISLFDTLGNHYVGPVSTIVPGSGYSGIGWLVGQSFYFNSCGTGGSLPPLVTSGGPPSACVGDTLTICAVGDILAHTVSFIPPSTAQTVSITASSPSIGSGFSVLSSSSGTSASLTFQVNSTGLTTGFYTVTVTATNSGSLSTTINYIVHIVGSAIPVPAIVVSPLVTCGSTPAVVTLTNSSSYTTYTWSTGATTPSISVATTSTVQVTVTNGSCSKTGSAVVQIYPAPTLTIGGAVTYCPPSTSTALYVNTSTTVTYNWNSGLATTDTLHATGTSTGTTYTVVVTDAHGCTNSASVTVTSGSITPLSITPKGSLCAGADTLISSINTATSYTWSPGLGHNSTYTVNAAGNYTLALTVNNCTVAATYSLSPPVPPVLAVTGNTVICAGTSTTMSVVATPTATAGYTYTWYNGSTPIGSTNTISLNTVGIYSVTAVNNNTQCKAAQTFTIIPATNPVVSIMGNLTYCKGHGDSLKSVVSGGTPSYTYSWNPGGDTTPNINAVPSNSVTSVVYSVTVTDSKGCKASAQQLLKQSNPHLLIPNPSLCPGTSNIITANGSGTAPLTYTWTNLTTGHQVIGKKDTVYSPLKYTVVMTDAYGCTVTDTVKVTQYPKPQASFAYSPTPPQQGSPTSFTDNSTIASPDSVKWDMWTFGDGDTVTANPNPTHTYANGGTYTVTLVVASEFGCLDTVTQVLNIQYTIIAPNIITPNGDGINEFLAFKNLQYFSNNKIWIYNRWGTQLYQDNDYKNNWTGKDYSDGTYFYILEVPDKHQTFKGFFESLK